MSRKPSYEALARRVVDLEKEATEHQEMREALKKSEQRLKQITENIHEVFWMTDPKSSKMLYVSPAYEDIWQRPVSELYENPRSWIWSIHKEHIKGVEENLERQSAGQSTQEEFRIVLPDGSIRWILNRAYPIKDKEGTVVHVTGVAEEITRRKRAEEELREVHEQLEEKVMKRTLQLTKVNRELQLEIEERKKAENALDESVSRYKAMFENMSNGVAVYRAVNEGENFIFVDVNKAVEKIEDISREELIGKSVLEVFPGVKEFGLFDVFQRVWATGNPEHHPAMLYEDERVKGWRENLVYKLPSGEIVAIYSDETERKKAEEALKHSQQQLLQAQKMDALGTLVAGVAHEINNPLSQVMFNMPLLQRLWHDFLPILKKHSAKEPGRKYGGLTYEFLEENLGQLLTDMEMAAKRVATIGGGLKDFSRRSDLADMVPLNINIAVENAMRLVRSTLKKSGVLLELDLAQDLPLMEGNLHCIEQIILNMTINAIEAIDHDKGKIVMTTGFQEKDGRVTLSIWDNGRGVSPSIADKIFDPFVTDKLTEGGTGLGLSVSYSLVRAHNGEIRFRSQEETGTTFTLFFPATSRRKAAKILLVDDDKSIRVMLKRALTKDRPYLVEETTNGREASIKIATHRPDLLILDILMPEMDGLEVCRTIKAEPSLSQMKVIIITGYPEHPKLKAVAELGFTNIFVKPFNLESILREVEDILG